MKNTADCERAEELAALLADDGAADIVDDGERSFFNNHIGGCNDCAALFEDLKRIFSEMKTLSEPELDEGFHTETMNMIIAQNAVKPVIGTVRPARRGRSAVQRVYRHFGTAAAAMLALVFVSAAVLGLSNGFDRIGFDRLGFAPMTGGMHNADTESLYSTAAPAEVNPFGAVSEAIDGRMFDTESKENGLSAFDTASEGITAQNRIPPGVRSFEPINNAPSPTAGGGAATGGGVAGFSNLDMTSEYYFTVLVDDVFGASDAVRELGLRLNAEIHQSLTAQGMAEFVKRVNVLDYDAVYSLLLQLGDIENALTVNRDITGEMADARIRRDAKEDEIDRLHAMMENDMDNSERQLLAERMITVYSELSGYSGLVEYYREMAEYCFVYITILSK